MYFKTQELEDLVNGLSVAIEDLRDRAENGDPSDYTDDDRREMSEKADRWHTLLDRVFEVYQDRLSWDDVRFYGEHDRMMGQHPDTR